MTQFLTEINTGPIIFLGLNKNISSLVLDVNGNPIYLNVVYQNVASIVSVAAVPLTNSSAILLSNATLNATYPSAKYAQLVLMPNVDPPCKYMKMDNSPTGIWELQPYNPNT